MSDDNKNPARTRKLERKNPTVRITNENSGSGAEPTHVVEDKGPFKNYENRNSLPGGGEGVENRAGSDRPVTRVFGRSGPKAGGDGEPAAAVEAEDSELMGDENPVTGWLVITNGPGRGGHVKIGYGMHKIGRDATQDIVIDFGDDSISRENHAKVEYDPETREFFIIKADNRVYLNGSRVGAGGELQMKTGDMVKMGDTEMRFVAFCGPDFDWHDSDD